MTILDDIGGAIDELIAAALERARGGRLDPQPAAVEEGAPF